MLPREFYDRNAVRVARELLGKLLVHRAEGIERVGRIIEVEAYLGPRDLASHASKGITARTKVLFGPPGFAYVYMIYGMYYCMNVVTGPAGRASAVLLRALEPVKNIDSRTHGPGLLCAAMHIDKRLNGHDLVSDEFHIAAGPPVKYKILRTPRIGVDYAGAWADKPLRFLALPAPAGAA